jgi:hypothetical protein
VLTGRRHGYSTLNPALDFQQVERRYASEKPSGYAKTPLLSLLSYEKMIICQARLGTNMRNLKRKASSRSFVVIDDLLEEQTLERLYEMYASRVFLLLLTIKCPAAMLTQFSRPTLPPR